MSVKPGQYVKLKERKSKKSPITKSGKVVYKNDYYFVVEFDAGYREGFLFVDFETKHLEMEECK